MAKQAYITESEIRYAMQHSDSNATAAKFLQVADSTWKKFASLFVDESTGKTLYELHKNPEKSRQIFMEMKGYGVYKKTRKGYTSTNLDDILDGKHPTYSKKKLKSRVIREGVLPECCSLCGFSERRIDDHTVPLIMSWKDGNRTNHRLENLELICYNCYMLTVADGDKLFSKKTTTDITIKYDPY